MTRTGTNESLPDEGEAAWLVALGGQPTPMSLDELDAAFRDGSIDETTLVWSPGMADWRALGEVIGAESDDDDLEAPLGLAEPAEEPMGEDDMPKVDPRLWILADEARAAQGAEAKYADPIEDDPTDEMELGAEDLDDDERPWGSAPQVPSVAVFTPGLAIPSATRRASPPQSVPPRKSAQTVPPQSKAAQTVPPRSSAAAQSVAPQSKPAQTLPPRASTVPRVPPPPRSRSLPPAPKAFDTLPPPVLNITALESTAPMVRTLSEPVIPIQPPPPGWNWRPWAAAAGAVFGLSMYGLSVLDLAASSADPKREAVVAAAEPLPAPEPNAERALPAAGEAGLRGSAGDTPVTAAVMPRALHAVAADVPAVTAEPDRSARVASPRKSTKKASKFSKKRKKTARSKASQKSRSKQPAWLAKFKASAR